MRQLLIIADDFGIGPETSRGILELARSGVVTGSVLLVNSPFAAEAVAQWRRAGRPMELGWHANLSLDRPVLDAARVRTLVGADGCFLPLSALLTRLYTGGVEPAHLRAELEAQHARFCEMVGQAPTLVNGHHHVHIFGPVGDILLDILARQDRAPYVRRVREPWSALWNVGGARSKRLLLGGLGRGRAETQERKGFPGNDWLVGTGRPDGVDDVLFHERCLESAAGEVVELMCHPGHLDLTLVGRDGLVQERAKEWRLLNASTLAEAIRRQGWQLTAPHQLAGSVAGAAYAA